MGYIEIHLIITLEAPPKLNVRDESFCCDIVGFCSLSLSLSPPVFDEILYYGKFYFLFLNPGEGCRKQQKIVKNKIFNLENFLRSDTLLCPDFNLRTFEYIQAWKR